ncbi:hypothetical protein LPJ55_001479 [Coemansia sp. RSA 990]|nr:hypothetical protein LPJ55_001479 [Coemansia sp. RSA 990]
MLGTDKLKFSITDEFGLWPRIEKEFTSRLPLRNLIWKGGITQTAQFVSQLAVEIAVNQESISGEEIVLPGQQQSHALLHICLVTIGEHESDTHKAEARGRVKAWALKAAQHKGASWLVVFVPSTNETTQRASAGPKFLNMRATIYDRLRSDIQSRKDANHVVQLRPEAIDSWNSLFLAVRERAVQGLEDRVMTLGEEIRRLDANRMLPGWNYCRFFMVKETLVSLYRALGLNDEALAQYDELEAAFFQLLDARQLAWFSKFGGGADGDDFTDILNLSKKPYRRQIADNTISMFDFRLYLFGQQSRLLIEMRQFEEFVVRAQRFVATLSLAMREPGTGLSAAFVAAWSYSTCQNIVEICEGVQLAQADRSGAGRVLAAAKAEFLTSARQQLDLLGTLARRLPPTYLRRSNTHTRVTTPELSDDANIEPNVTNPVLAEALGSDERFDQVYVRTCEQATQYYLESGRRRFAQVLQGDIAQLHICRRRWSDAVRILRPLVPADSLHVMDVHLAERLAVCERELGHKDACLDLVLRLVENSQFLDAQSCTQHAAMLEELVNEVPAARQIQSKLFRAGDVAADDEAGFGVVVDIRSKVPRTLRAKRIEALLVAGNRDVQQLEVTMDADDVELSSDLTRVRLGTDVVSCPGRFEVQSLRIFIGHIEFIVPVSNPNARRFVRLNAHPASPRITFYPEPKRLRVKVAASNAPIDAGMRIWLHDANSHLLQNRSGDDGTGMTLTVADAVAADSHAMLEVALDGTQPASGEVSVYAEYSVDGELRMLLDTELVEFVPPLRLSAHIEQGQQPDSASILQVRAQCCALDPVRLHTLCTDGKADADSAQLSGRGFLLFAETATVVQAIDTVPSSVDVHVEFSSLLDVLQAQINDYVCSLAAEHKLSRHTRYLQRLIMAHVRQTIDAPATLRESRLVCEPFAPLWSLASQDCSQEVRAAMRRLFHKLSGQSLDTSCSCQRSLDMTLELALVTPAYVTVSLDSRFCRAFEAASLRVRLQLDGTSGKRLSVMVVSSECMVAGAAAQEVSVRGSVELHFSIVPLATGYLPLPEVICHEYTDDLCWTRLHTMLCDSPSSLCVLQNDSLPVICSVPVGFAACAANFFTHPLDLLKVRLQTTKGANGGLTTVVRSIISQQGVLGFYNGISAAVLRQMTYSMARFATYEELKKQMSSPDGSLPFYRMAVAGITAGAVGGICGTPADIVLVRLQNDGSLPAAQRRNYKNAFDGLFRIARAEGPLGLFKGAVPNVSRAMLMTGAQLCSYDGFKQLLLSTPYFSEGLLLHFSASFLSGFVSTTITSPFDVVKTRVMNAGSNSPYRNLFQAMVLITKEEGIRALYKGWTPSFVRMAPQTILTFIFLEQFRNFYWNRYSIRKQVRFE